MRKEAVFLDLDDTLYPYNPCNEAGKKSAWRKAKRIGYDLSWTEFQDLYQKGRREAKKELASMASSHERFIYFKKAIEIYKGSLKADDTIKITQNYWRDYLEEMNLFKGVEATLKNLKRNNIKIVIISNLTAWIQLKKIRNLEIEDYIDLMITSEETGDEKPSSIMFTLPLAKLGITPKQSIMVGDSIEADIMGANSINIETILFKKIPEKTSRPGKQPDHSITDFTKIIDIIK